MEAINSGNKKSMIRSFMWLVLLFLAPAILFAEPFIKEHGADIILSPSAPANSRLLTPVDIGIFNENCADFTVRLRPSADIINSNVTNIQFTVKWPANTVNLINPVTLYGVYQQGPVMVYEGYNYAVFVSVEDLPVDWTAGQEITILTLSHSQSGSGYASFEIADDAWCQANNAVFFIELLGIDNTGIIYHNEPSVYLGPCSDIDIGLFSTGCGRLEVRLKPHVDIIDLPVTNIQFTLKWKPGPTGIQWISSAFGLEQQGPVILYDDTNYCVFVSVEPVIVNWAAEQEYVVAELKHTGDAQGYGDFLVADDDWANTNNGVYFAEVLGLDQTGIIYHQALNSYLGNCEVNLKVLLEGPYNPATQMMYTHLNQAGYLPLTQPYNAAPWNYTGMETRSMIPDSVVDWILVELRDSTNEALVIAKRAGFLLDNGRIVDTSLVNGVAFDTLEYGRSYFVTVWHRNHMPVMTGTAIPLPNTGLIYDFTDLTITQPYGHNNPRPAEIELLPAGSGIYGMIAGDINMNKQLKYVGLNNDRDLIAMRIIMETGQPYLNLTASGYFNEDITMNGIVKYAGAGNDRDLIIMNLITLTGSVLLNNSYDSTVP